MKKLLGISSFLCIIFLFAIQTAVTSCTKESIIYKTDTLTVTRIDTLNITRVDTFIIKDTAVSLALLTANSWKVQEIRGVIGNTITLYQRGGKSNTENYDDEFITFRANKTGILYDADGGFHNLTWDFWNGESNKIVFIVQNLYSLPSQTVFYENLRYKNGALYFDQYWTYNGINSHVQSIRIPK